MTAESNHEAIDQDILVENENQINGNGNPAHSSNTMNMRNLRRLNSNSTDDEEMIDESDLELPDALIATNVPNEVFGPGNIARTEFELLFLNFDPTATFNYLKNFKRVRINLASPEIATQARIALHCTEFNGQLVKVFFAQPYDGAKDAGGLNLRIPAPHRQFLISPPASPPVGWEPHPEAEPVINYELLHAISSLIPGQSHELQPSIQGNPSIVVHPCPDDSSGGSASSSPPPPQRVIQQTRCPPRKL